jgi:hypothetical protein
VSIVGLGLVVWLASRPGSNDLLAVIGTALAVVQLSLSLPALVLPGRRGSRAADTTDVAGAKAFLARLVGAQWRREQEERGLTPDRLITVRWSAGESPAGSPRCGTRATTASWPARSGSWRPGGWWWSAHPVRVRPPWPSA